MRSLRCRRWGGGRRKQLQTALLLQRRRLGGGGGGRLKMVLMLLYEKLRQPVRLDLGVVYTVQLHTLPSILKFGL